ncbi:MAG: hypothetical protein QXU13_01125 [Desulfurococcaceae archaeon]
MWRSPLKARGEIVETIGIYKNIPLTIDPSLATVFAVIGWLIVLCLVLYTVYKWTGIRRKEVKK